MKPIEATQINFILSRLRTGTERNLIMDAYGLKWPSFSERTFRRRFKQAYEAYALELATIKEQAGALVAEAAKKVAIEIMTTLERQQYLTSVVTCETDIKVIGKLAYQLLVHPDGRKEIITMKDKIRALAELNKMDGSYSAVKNEVNISTNEPVKATVTFISDKTI